MYILGGNDGGGLITDRDSTLQSGLDFWLIWTAQRTLIGDEDWCDDNDDDDDKAVGHQ